VPGPAGELAGALPGLHPRAPAAPPRPGRRRSVGHSASARAEALPHLLRLRGEVNPAGVATSTIAGVLRARALDTPERIAYRFLRDGEVEESALSYAALDEKARAIAAWLQEAGAAGERAILLYPPGVEFVAAFFGCLYAGVVAVPAYPPRPNRPDARIQQIVADAAARFVL